ncbi:MAG: homoserine dehydrogenase [Gammaproteobacteria bacterium]|nr:homoserine dehydrogenase [Gammaproteobacteria bacterium]
MSDPIRVGLLGLGTVGQGVVRVLQRNAEEIARRAGRPIVISRASARDPNKARDCELSQVAIESDPMRVVTADDVDLVVELIGGETPAFELIGEAIRRGKPVVTANKALVAERGNELFELARGAGTMIAYEAAVAGGIPIIKSIREGLAANRVLSVVGIINGTCNYILTQMSLRGIDFGTALTEAQQLGYAEADPTFDVEGVDAAHKLTILASIAFGIPLAFERVACEGITRIQSQDIELAKALGYRIKHLGIAKRGADGVELRVQPTLIADDQLLAKVDGVLNAIVVHGDAVGRTGYYGRGAGGEATASAVIADLVDAVRSLDTPPQHRVPYLAFQPDAIAPMDVLPLEQIESAYYLRVCVADEPGVLRAITSILAELDISVEAIIQKEPRAAEDAVVAIITSVVQEARFNEACARIEALPSVRSGFSRLRVEHFDS